MKSIFQLQSYKHLFSLLALGKEDDDLSVYSPSAYLVDLLQLLDDKLPEYSQKLDRRREDIKEDIELNAENTYTSIPYLDIVNRILETKISSSTSVEFAKYPFNLPFNFDNERVKKFLSYLDVSLEDLYKIFIVETDWNIVAREYLKLSQEEYDIFNTDISDLNFSEYWGKDFENLQQDFNVAKFLRIANLTGEELIEILYQNLSLKSTQKEEKAVKSEIEEARNFFYNDNNGYVKLDEHEETLIWEQYPQPEENANSAEEIPIPQEWFKRVNLFIRLAKKTTISFTDLDLILRSCCDRKINKKSIQIIAIVKKIHDEYEIPIDIVCSFLSDINILGIGDEERPQDLFNRIFNAKFADIDKKYITVSELEFIPDRYSDYTILTCSDDLLSVNNKEYRQRLCQALNIPEKELILIVKRFRAWSDATSKVSLLDIKQPMDLSALSLLFRISKLSDVLDISSTELFHLLDILGQDISLHNSIHNFKVLIDYLTQEQDCYQIIQGKNVNDSLWLIQLLFAVVEWMQSNDFNSQELQLLLTGKEKDKKVEETKKSQKINHLNNVYQQFKPFMFSSELLESETFDSRSASILYDIITEEGSGLVSQYDSGILTGDFSSVKTVFYDALTQLDVIIPEDFAMLGFGSKILDKIFKNLIIHEYINTEGYINEEKVSLIDRNFTIETDFCSLKADLFGLIQNLLVDEIEFTKSNNELDEDRYNDEFEEVYAESIEYFFIYPSDLAYLENLTELQRNELYDNLIFNGYIDEFGKVLQPDFFSFEDNVNEFKINVDIIDASVEILNIISEQTEQFVKEELILNKNIFAHLKLKEFEIDDLIENLRFNGYLDKNNVLQNKEELVNLDVKDFNLALVFYPHRRKILTAIKELITELKSQFYTLSRETFAQIAEDIVGQWIYQDIVNQYQEEDYRESNRDTFFLEPEQLPQLTLRSYFSADDIELIANTIDDIINRSHKYRFTTDLIEEFYFDAITQDELIAVLQENNFLLEKGIIPEDKLDYFLNIDNALTFETSEENCCILLKAILNLLLFGSILILSCESTTDKIGIKNSSTRLLFGE